MKKLLIDLRTVVLAFLEGNSVEVIVHLPKDVLHCHACGVALIDEDTCYNCGAYNGVDLREMAVMLDCYLDGDMPFPQEPWIEGFSI